MKRFILNPVLSNFCYLIVMTQAFAFKDVKIQGFQATNNNALFAKSSNNAGLPISFKNQLAQVRHANELISEQTISSQIKEEFAQQDIEPKKTATSNVFQNSQFSTLLQNVSPELRAKLEKIREEEEVKNEHIKNELTHEDKKDSEEVYSRLHADENTIANAGQEHHKQVTEAVREGNVAQREARQEHSNDRKKQLANWEDLAPRIVEDAKNRAVRIDIPGMVDLETVIVRMNQGSVVIQAVGNKDAMERLQAGENVLSSNLRKYNIQLESLQAFDSDLLRQGVSA